MTEARRLTLVMGVAQTLAWASTYYIPATIIGAASAEFGVSRTVLLAGFSLALLVCGVCSPAVGRRIDRQGGRGVMALSALATAAGLFVIAASPTIWIWSLGWMAVGAGMALGLYDAAFATVGRLLGVQARPVIVGITLMAGFASTLGWPVGAWLVSTYGWRASVVAYGVLQLVVILPMMWLLVPAAGPAQAAPAAPRTEDAPPPRWTFLWMASYFTLRAGISAVISVHALTLLAGFGASEAQAVTAATLIGPAQVASRVLDWRFGRGFNPMVAALTGSVLLPAGFLLLLGGAPFMLFSLVYGMSNGILTISRGTLPLHVFGPSGYGSRLGRIAMPSMVASAVAPTLISPLIDRFPAMQVTSVLGAIALVSLGCILVLRR